MPALFLCGSAYAGCRFYVYDDYRVNAVQHFTVPLAASAISVPPGTATGTVIFEQKINLKNTPKFSIMCDAVGDFMRTENYDSHPYPPISTGSKIYKTNIAGIGVRFRAGDPPTYSFPVNYYSSTCTAASDDQYCNFTKGWVADTTIQLIKTDNTVGTGAITGASLPTSVYTAGQSGSMVDIYKINISGSLSVNIPTCDITSASQSMVVPMGKHHVADFSGVGSGTEWKDASIRLNNCGHFYGNSSAAIASFDGTSNVPLTDLTSNAAVVTLTPLDGNIKPEEGVMALSDSSSATGIGIQLSSSESESGKINLNAAYTKMLPKDGTTNFTIPLFARYIQTENAVGAGTANGKLEYTISYR